MGYRFSMRRLEDDGGRRVPREVEVERVGRRSQLLDQPLLEPENRDAPTLKSDPHSVSSSSSRALGTFVAAVGDNLDLMGF